MRIIILSAIALAFAVGGCEPAEGKSTDAAHPANDSKAANVPADNTKKNERDRDTSALTPGDQGESEGDRTITQRIRQAVMKDDALSFTAKNVKIITLDGVVTLRGPVKSEKEKADIGTLAQHVEGIKRVDNQLEVAPN
jgi:osmotically-inducible protein OsmY